MTYKCEHKSRDRWVLGLDIGGTRIRLAFINKNGYVYNFKALKSRDFKKDSQTDERLASLVEQNVLQSDISWEQLDAIVLGLPATLDRRNKIVYSCPNFRDLEGEKVLKTFEARFPVPIVIENDVNLAIVGEHWLGAAQGYQDVLGIFVGTGLGCGIILNGRLHQGSHGVAAELGHIPVPEKDDVCGCGNRGCIELYAAGVALERALQEHQEASSDIQEIFLRARNGDKFWQHTVRQFLTMLAIAIATAINIIDPQVVIIGGGIPQIPGFPFNELVEKVFSHTRKPEPARSLHIKRAVLGDLAGLIGAAKIGSQTAA